jgi:hypothetical protein
MHTERVIVAQLQQRLRERTAHILLRVRGRLQLRYVCPSDQKTMLFVLPSRLALLRTTQKTNAHAYLIRPFIKILFFSVF